MKRLLLAIVIVGTLYLPAPAQKKGADDFNDLIKRYYAAWNTMNPDNASFLYAQDADLVFFDIAPLKYSGGWREYRDNFKKNVAPEFSSLVLTPHNDVKVTRRGNIALTTLTFICWLNRRTAACWSLMRATQLFGKSETGNG